MAYIIKHKSGAYKAKKKARTSWVNSLDRARVYTQKSHALQSIGIKWKGKFQLPESVSILPVKLDQIYTDKEGFEFREVESSVIRMIAWKDDNLKIIIKDRVYGYQKVPEVVYQALISADSKGKFFNKYINRVYPSYSYPFIE